MKTHALVFIFAMQVLLLAGCSKSAKTDLSFPIEMDNLTNAEDMQNFSNILSSHTWPIFKLAESGKCGNITIPFTMGTNLDARHYNVTWNGYGWQISPTNQ